MPSTLQEKQGYKETELGWIPDNWDVKQMSEVTDIRLSNVDKKTSAGESPVKLCNYMDVYKNRYIKNSFNFMEATANENQIERFTLRFGDVLMTKDSETQDDIGISAVVKEELHNVLCGYHLALLRPNLKYINSFYLMNFISSNQIKEYFAKQANGITRFGLSSGAISNTPLLLPPITEQHKIAEILSTVDEKIEKVEKQIKQAEQLKKALMQELLTKGIGHTEFKDTKVGNIPLTWKVKELDEISDITRLAGYEYSEYWKEDPSGEITTLRGYNIGKGKIIERDFVKISNELSMQLKRSRLYKNDVVFPCVGTIGNAVKVTEDNKYHINQNIAKITPYKKLDSDFLVQFLISDKCKKEIFRFNATTSQPNVLVGSLRKFRVAVPDSIEEQQKIAEILSTADQKIEILQNKKSEYEKLKKGLMQKLLTGQIRVRV